jgi:prevent-host-death family protein
MVKVSLANAKAHLSELVDRAEHQKKQILILRHGKPAAALVPVEKAVASKQRLRRSPRQIAAFFERAAALGDPTVDAVQELLRSRR